MFAEWYMKGWVETLFLANSFHSKAAQFHASSERQAHPCCYRISSAWPQAAPAEGLDGAVFSSAEQWQSPATGNHWRDLMNFSPPPSPPDHLQTYWVTLRRGHLFLPLLDSEFFHLDLWLGIGRFHDVDRNFATVQGFKPEIITYLTLTISSRQWLLFENCIVSSLLEGTSSHNSLCFDSMTMCLLQAGYWVSIPYSWKQFHENRLKPPSSSAFRRKITFKNRRHFFHQGTGYRLIILVIVTHLVKINL